MGDKILRKKEKLSMGAKYLTSKERVEHMKIERGKKEYILTIIQTYIHVENGEKM